MNIIITTADQNLMTSDREINVSISPIDLPNHRIEVSLFSIPYRSNILGYDVILGLDALSAMKVRIESSNAYMVASINGIEIARQNQNSTQHSLMLTSCEMHTSNNQFEALLQEYNDIFAESATTLIRTAPMEIHLERDFGKKVTLRHQSIDNIMEIERQVVKMIDNDIIEPSTSKYSANVHLVPKKNGTRRMVVDFRYLNSIATKDTFPLPQISDMFLALRDATCFAALDCTEGFLQIPIHPEHRHRTAFITSHGCYQFKRVPFGFTNSPAVFQRTMNRIFNEGLYRICVIYIDDILVFGKSEDELLDNLKWVFQRCRDGVIKLKRSKCKINVKECEFLGFKISFNRISPVIGKYDPIGVEIPQNKTHVRGILGALNHYARFIENYADKTAPLRVLTRKETKFEWDEKLTILVRSLKAELNRAISETIPDTVSPKVIDITISPISAEVTCYENKNLVGRAGKTWSTSEKNYTSVEQQLLAIALAYNKFGPFLKGHVTFRTTCKNLRAALQKSERTERVTRLMLTLPPDSGFEIEIVPGRSQLETAIASEEPPEEIFYTDGACLRNGKKTCKASWAVLATMNKNLSKAGLVEHVRLSNQVAELMAAIKACEIADSNKMSNIIIMSDSKYVVDAATGWIKDWEKTGWKGYNKQPVENRDLFKRFASYLSKINVQCLHVKGHATDSNNLEVDRMAKQVLEAEYKLGFLAIGLQSLQQENDEEIELIKANLEADEALRDRFTVENGELFYIDATLPEPFRKRLYVSEGSRKLLLKIAHDDPLYGGHLGIKKVRFKLQPYYWRGMSNDIERYIRSCLVCQQHKNPRKPRYGLLQPIKLSKVFERLHVDIVGPLKLTHNNNDYILTAIDAFSRYAYARAVKGAKTSIIIQFLTEEIITKHGVPSKIVSDNGPQFTSKPFKEFVSKLDIQHSRTCDYHPEANGLDERLNGTLIKIVRNYTQTNQSDWDTRLPWAVMLYNTTRQESIQTSPYVALYGVQPRTPLRMLGQQAASVSDPLEQQLELDRHQPIRKSIEKAAEEAQLRQKKYYDSKRKEQNFKPLDLVKVKNHTSGKDLSKKLFAKWDTPCVVTQMIEHDGQPVAAKVRNLETGKERRTPFSDMYHLEEREDDELIEQPNALPGDLIQSITAQLSKLSDDSIDELVDITNLGQTPDRPSLSLRSPSKNSLYEERTDEIARPELGSQGTSANQIQTHSGSQTAAANRCGRDLGSWAEPTNQRLDNLESQEIPANSLNADLGSWTTTTNQDPEDLGSQNSSANQAPDPNTSSMATKSGVNSPLAIGANSSTSCVEASNGGGSNLARSISTEPPIDLLRNTTQLLERPDPTGTNSENRELSDREPLENSENITSEQQQCSTPITLSNPPPVNLDAETTSLIQLEDQTRQVSIPDAELTQVNRLEVQESEERGRPKRSQRPPARYQP